MASERRYAESYDGGSWVGGYDEAPRRPTSVDLVTEARKRATWAKERGRDAHTAQLHAEWGWIQAVIALLLWSRS